MVTRADLQNMNRATAELSRVDMQLQQLSQPGVKITGVTISSGQPGEPPSMVGGGMPIQVELPANILQTVQQQLQAKKQQLAAELQRMGVT
jgi:hypothetical protein